MDTARVGQHEDQVIQIQKMRRISEYLLENHGRLPFFWEILILARYDFSFFRFWVSMLLTGNALPGLRKTLTAFVPRYFTSDPYRIGWWINSIERRKDNA